LREWPDVAEARVPPRTVNPLDEEILVVPRGRFLSLLGRPSVTGLHQADFVDVVSASEVVSRREAEQTEDFVQLIPSFVILREREVLSYKRTKKTPESRLHDTRSIIFGGHLQAEDVPVLFISERDVITAFLFRELHEELSLSPPARKYIYAGVIYLDQTPFERQHAGLVFILEAAAGAMATSLEPGYHSSLEFIAWDRLRESSVMNDRWSATCVAALEKRCQ
jgi:predicted NUDIX family phosphoesterase